MSATDNKEIWDRLTFLLIAQPREGWENTYEEITRRELERLAPHPDDGNKKEVSRPPSRETPRTI